MNKWNANYIPDLSGKLIIITGATSGLGLENARVLTNKNGGECKLTAIFITAY